MAHMIETAFFGRNLPAWHGLGTTVDGLLTAEQAMVTAGLDWTADLRPIYTARDAAGQFTEIDTHRAVVRNTDNTTLGVVGARWRPIQNVNAFGFFDSVIGAGKAVYDTAGSLAGGKRVWILAKLPDPIEIAKQPIEKYLLLVNHHDGEGSLRVMFTPVRVVCQNTLNMALAGRNADGIRIRHTVSAESRLQEAEKAVRCANEYYAAFQEAGNYLVTRPFTDADMKVLVTRLFPDPDDAERNAWSVAQKRDAVTALFENGAGHDVIAGTAWAAVNAVAEYADHNMRINKPSADKRFASILDGPSASLKRDGFNIVCDMVA